MSWVAEAPSNIALIKYMGKTDTTNNLPTNSSLSYTLSHLLTRVKVEESNSTSWDSFDEEDFKSIELSEKGQNRFLKHWDFLKTHFAINGDYKISSANNFPSDCGLASSASSFAALTLAAFSVAQDKGSKNLDLTVPQLAELSRQGSGSSCRSLFPVWAEWGEEGVNEVELPYENLNHCVVLADTKKKDVSSSEAHVRVLTSDLFKGRVERAQTRVEELKSAMTENDWRQVCQICWTEFWDMHALFETSVPSFGYMNGQSVDGLNTIRAFSTENNIDFLVTMDAGANIHILSRKEDETHFEKLVSHLKQNFEVYS